MIPLFGNKKKPPGVLCPKCGQRTRGVALRNLMVDQCEFGCGVWINQADLEKGMPETVRPSIEAEDSLWWWKGRRGA